MKKRAKKMSNVLTKDFEKRIPARTVYVWFVNNSESVGYEEKSDDRDNCRI